MKKVFKYLFFACIAIKAISTFLLVHTALSYELFYYTCFVGFPYGIGLLFSQSSVIGAIGFLMLLSVIFLMPVVLIMALTFRGITRRICVIFLGALSLVDVICCAICICTTSPPPYIIVNLLLSMVTVTACVLTVVQDRTEPNEPNEPNRTVTDLFWINTYMILTAVALFLFAISGNELVYFMGASSVTATFLFGIVAEKGWIVMLSMAWVLAFVVLLIWFYLLTLIKKQTRPFFIITALDLLVTLALGIWCAFNWNGDITEGFTILFGTAVRLLYYLLMLRKTKLKPCQS